MLSNTPYILSKTKDSAENLSSGFARAKYGAARASSELASTVFSTASPRAVRPL